MFRQMYCAKRRGIAFKNASNYAGGEASTPEWSCPFKLVHTKLRRMGEWKMENGWSSWLLGVFTRRLTDFPHARDSGKIYWQCGSAPATAPLRWQKCSTMTLVQTMLNARSLRAVCQLGSSGPSPPIHQSPQSLANSFSSPATRSIPASDSDTMRMWTRMRPRKRSALVAIIDINASQLAF